jgi:hypothetical protein
MLGGKSYTRDEVDHCKAAVDQQHVAYTDKKATSALEAFEALFFNNMTLASTVYRRRSSLIRNASIPRESRGQT